MDLYEAITTIKSGGRIEIPDCSRDDLPALCVKLGYTVGAEIGVQRGKYLKKWADAGLTMYGVDPWMRSEDYDISQEEQDAIFEEAKECLRPYPNVQLIRSTSLEATKILPELDFVYIDGHHGFRYIADDLWEWTKKVRKGGLISGHDYAFNGKAPYHPYALHVKYVVNAWVEVMRIDPWFVLGRKNRREGEQRETWRSWMWINNHA